MQHSIITGGCAYMPYLPSCRDANRCIINMRLNSALGYYVSVKTHSANTMQTIKGTLFEVGKNYIMLYDCNTGTYSVVSLGCICGIDIYPPNSMDNENNNMPDDDSGNGSDSLENDNENNFDDNDFGQDDDMQNNISDAFASFSGLDSASAMMYNSGDIGVG